MPTFNSARRLIKVCAEVYGGALVPSNDIDSRDNIVAKYAETEIQRKYVHMYFAKYVGCWRAIRKKLGVTGDHGLVSIGAGPLLCCMGWLWDTAPRNDGVTVRAYDALDWQGVQGLPEFLVLWGELGVRGLDYRAARYFPEGNPPPQISGIEGAKPISIKEIGSGNVVLLPSVLNHVLGLSGPMDAEGKQRVFDWIEGVRQAGNMVVIADMLYRSNTAGFWQSITRNLRAPRGGDHLNLDFSEEATAASEAYEDAYQARRRAGLIADSNKVGVLRGSSANWAWVF